jgi:hypothetical protein
MGLKESIVGFVLAGVFIIGLITFGIQMGIDNNAPQNIGDDPSIQEYRDDITSSLGDYQGQINATTNAFSSTNPVVGQESTQIPTTARTGVDYWVLPKAVYRFTLRFTQENIFGGDTGLFGLIITVIGSVIVVVFILWVYPWIRSGVLTP